MSPTPHGLRSEWFKLAPLNPLSPPTTEVINKCPGRKGAGVCGWERRNRQVGLTLITLAVVPKCTHFLESFFEKFVLGWICSVHCRTLHTLKGNGFDCLFTLVSIKMEHPRPLQECTNVCIIFARTGAGVIRVNPPKKVQRLLCCEASRGQILAIHRFQPYHRFQTIWSSANFWSLKVVDLRNLIYVE